MKTTPETIKALRDAIAHVPAAGITRTGHILTDGLLTNLLDDLEALRAERELLMRVALAASEYVYVRAKQTEHAFGWVPDEEMRPGLLVGDEMKLLKAMPALCEALAALDKAEV